MYEKQFEEIERLYKEEHARLHNTEYKTSWGETVHGMRMYRASEAENEGYVSVEMRGLSINKNGHTKMEGTYITKEDELTASFSPAAFLHECIEILKAKGEKKFNDSAIISKNGSAPAPIVQVVKDVEVREIVPHEYAEAKGKADVLDKLLSKRSVTISE